MSLTPKLDYYVGRPVESIESESGWDWAIRFSGDVLVRNTDKRRTAAPSDELVGQLYFTAILGETDTRLQFGHYDADQQPVVDSEVVLTPTQYTITDERFEGGPHFPQSLDAEEQDLLPDDPSVERVVDGPETPPDARERKWNVQGG